MQLQVLELGWFHFCHKAAGYEFKRSLNLHANETVYGDN